MRIGFTFPPIDPNPSATPLESADIPGIKPIPTTPPAIADSLRKSLRLVAMHSLRFLSDDLKYAHKFVSLRLVESSLLTASGLDTRLTKILFQGC
jgi:hypothetical protein